MKIQKLVSAAMLAVLASTISFAQEDVPKAVAVPTAEAKQSKPAPAKPAANQGTSIEKVSGVRPLNVTADLTTGTAISGTLVEVDVLLIKTAFGEASVPLSEIAGIRFPNGDNDDTGVPMTSVGMLNGDSITGATDIKMVTIETDWGTAKINGSAIRSIMFVPNVQWTSSASIGGKRWALQDAKAPAGQPGQPGQPANSQTVQPAGSISNPAGVVIPAGGNRGVFPNSR